MRHSLLILALLVFSAPITAAMLSIDTDKLTYNVSDTITVTMTLAVDGSEAGFNSAFVEISWNGAVGTGAAASSQSGNLTSFGGGLPWIPGTGTCLSSSRCVMIDQLQGLTSFAPDPNVIVGTLLIHAAAVGTLDLAVEASSFFAFGLTAGDVTFSANAANAGLGIPEPGTAAMLGLGLLGLARLRRRR